MLSVATPVAATSVRRASAAAAPTTTTAQQQRSSSTAPACAHWAPTVLDMRHTSAAQLAEAIKADNAGVLILTNTQTAPFDSLAELFARVTPELGRRANAAVASRNDDNAGMRLAWKDAHGDGRGGLAVDDKRVIDLSPSRIQEIRTKDPGLSAELGEPLAASLAFFERATRDMVPPLVEALRRATGCGDFTEDEARVSWRMVEHRQRVVVGDNSLPPRCSAHRDFGTATLIYASGPGLEVRVKDEWHALPALPTADACVLLFGLCTAWRSNDRVRAAEHRVADAVVSGDEAAAAAVVSPSRLSAVLFLGLCDDAPLRPAVVEGEPGPRYITTCCGKVHPTVRRKWSSREGSVTAAERAQEEAERQLYPTQEALIEAQYKLLL